VSRSVRVGDAVGISWPSDLIPEFKDRLDGKVGVVLSIAGRICTPARGHECLYRVNVAGRVHHLGSSHLEPLRPDLDEYVHSTRFALTGADVVADHLGKQRY
jgi:hypothetical protein